MKLFHCQGCGQPMYFETSRCESCGRRLGFLPSALEVVALDEVEGVWQTVAEPRQSYRFCANAAYDACNWLVPAGSPESFCIACRHNRLIPDLTFRPNVDRWRRLEAAKRRLFYTLLQLDLPIATRTDGPDGLAFDFLGDPPFGSPYAPSVMTGHDNGVITINIAEADDDERERRRRDMGEPYRTLLGHFRHEIAHYYWNVLIYLPGLEDGFRSVFGDERQDYDGALYRHYAYGPPRDWQQNFVSTYASAHPWEDWAETWAHYLHMVDTLETASTFGLMVAAGNPATPPIDFDPHRMSDLSRLIETWLPLTFAVNSLNRSMGQPDLYPFVLTPSVIGKLAFVHARVYEATGRVLSGDPHHDLIRAVAAGLRSRIASPPPS